MVTNLALATAIDRRTRRPRGETITTLRGDEETIYLTLRYSGMSRGDALEVRMDDEFLHVNGEREARPANQRDYLDALRSALRQAPDLLLVGEAGGFLRGGEGITSALTSGKAAAALSSAAAGRLSTVLKLSSSMP